MDDDKFYDEVNSTTYQDYDEFKISNALRRCDGSETECEDCKFYKRCMVEEIMDQNRTTPVNPIDAEEYAYEILKEAGLK